MKSEQVAKGKDQWERKLAGYVVVGGAMLGAADQAQADPIYSGLQNIAIGIDQTVDLDVNGDTVVDYQFVNSLNASDPLDEIRQLDLLTTGSNLAAAFGVSDFAKSLDPGSACPAK